jgi:hypothetical protein
MRWEVARHGVERTDRKKCQGLVLLAGGEVLEEGRGEEDGEVVIGREEGVLIAVAVGVDDGKMPVVGSTRVMPTFKDGGASLVIGLDIMLGEDNSKVGVAEGGNANQVSGE